VYFLRYEKEEKIQSFQRRKTEKSKSYTTKTILNLGGPVSLSRGDF